MPQQAPLESAAATTTFVFERSAYTWAARHPTAVLTLAALAGAALVIAGVRRRRHS